jgi:hypothetical protein
MNFKKCQLCLNCEHARQAGNLDSQDVVGCVLLNRDGEEYQYITETDSAVGIFDGVKQHEVLNSNIYKGYIYFGRRPGDVQESNFIGKGAITLGLLVDSKGYCKKFEERK